MNAEPGWYQAEGDPPGTVRYWDGGQWVGEPTHPPGAASPAKSPGNVGESGWGHGLDSGPGAFTLATPGKRFGGRFIDCVIVLAIAAVVVGPVILDMIEAVVDVVDEPNFDQADVDAIVERELEGSALRFGILGIITILWDWFFYSFLGGTPGKLIVGTRVVPAKTGTGPLGVGRGFLRSINRIVWVLSGVIAAIGNLLSIVLLLVALASVVMLFSDSRRRTVLDRIAGTVVIDKP